MTSRVETLIPLSVLEGAASLHDSAPITGPLYYSQYAREHFHNAENCRASIPCSVRVTHVLDQLGVEIPPPTSDQVSPQDQIIEEYEQEEFLEGDILLEERDDAEGSFRLY